MYITTRVVAAQSKVLRFKTASFLVCMSEFKADLCVLKEITKLCRVEENKNIVIF